MGLLDLPAPAYGLIDGAAATVLPPVGRLLLWAALGGLVSMGLYRVLAPQAGVAAAKSRAVAARRRLNAHEGDFASALPLIREQLDAALKQCALVLPATLIASLPVLTLLVWMDKTYAYGLPDADVQPSVAVTPEEFEGQWHRASDGPWIRVLAPDGDTIGEVPVKAAIPVIEKWRWWNVLSDNPAGYLPEAWPVERVEIGLAQRSYLPFGPEWTRSWIVVFMPALLLVSIALHRILRIE